MNTPRVTTPFGPATTAEETVEGVDLFGKQAVVTGASSGIGVETARALAKAGADVTLAVRDVAAGEKAAADIVASTGDARVRAAYLDLSVRDSIDAFVASWRGPLDILVANAGVMAVPERRTAEGWEMQFATNHLGHFALALGLHDALAAAGHARVVVVSSVGHINGDVIWDDPNFEENPYDEWKAYSQSKTANILFAVEAARRWAEDGIVVNALNPGRIWGTGLSRHMSTPPASFEPGSSDGVSVKDISQGAATSTLLAASPLVEGVTGRYFEDCEEAAPHAPGLRRGFASYAVDPGAAVRLWRLSLDMIADADRRKGA
ncbi:SDR family NAD(P)-dependent oxidoreductase [Planotetraspora kaengkrachanensis]|uniref:Probable oxidoreductase n=1 Tax=Planotetraspora kaengkrachanensis TaxID=575193 RepID=A0A8J3PU04_9ACTN|nr:SDR family NAD(P)-dependent oxidoreductase [Planotetraspora kaengkrachanensis]GIG81023.1 oxidoreductase [Planotetraspora kaengkrachanensis]